LPLPHFYLLFCKLGWTTAPTVGRRHGTYATCRHTFTVRRALPYKDARQDSDCVRAHHLPASRFSAQRHRNLLLPHPHISARASPSTHTRCYTYALPPPLPATFYAVERIRTVMLPRACYAYLLPRTTCRSTHACSFSRTAPHLTHTHTHTTYPTHTPLPPHTCTPSTPSLAKLHGTYYPAHILASLYHTTTPCTPPVPHLPTTMCRYDMEGRQETNRATWQAGTAHAVPRYHTLHAPAPACHAACARAHHTCLHTCISMDLVHHLLTTGTSVLC